MTGTNVGALPECGEHELPNSGEINADGGRSVWYRWTAPDTARMAFATTGSSFDTILDVYSGSSVDAEPIVTNDDIMKNAAYGGPSLVLFDAQAGHEYSIQVDGYKAASGAILLSWARLPVNDNFASAQVITGSSAGVTGNNLGASAEADEPSHSGCDPGRSVWYVWQAPTDTPTGTPTHTLTMTPVPTTTATPSVTPTPTPTRVPCVGDCNGSDSVTVAEILTMVNIALGNAAVDLCEPGDRSGDGHITIDEILTAVNNALNGCP